MSAKIDCKSKLDVMEMAFTGAKRGGRRKRCGRQQPRDVIQICLIIRTGSVG